MFVGHAKLILRNARNANISSPRAVFIMTRQQDQGFIAGVNLVIGEQQI